MIKLLIMIKQLLYISFGLMGLVLTSCNDTPEDIVEAITPNVKATINTNSFETNVAAGINTVATVVITATQGNEVIVLTIPSTATGVYEIDAITTNASYTPNINDSLNAIYVGYQGQVEITDVNTIGTQVQGNFNFKCVNAVTLDTITVSAGELNNIPIKL